MLYKSAGDQPFQSVGDQSTHLTVDQPHGSAGMTPSDSTGDQPGGPAGIKPCGSAGDQPRGSAGTHPFSPSINSIFVHFLKLYNTFVWRIHSIGVKQAWCCTNK